MEQWPREIWGIVGMINVDQQPKPTWYLCAFDFLRVRRWDSGTISVEFTPQRDVVELDVRRGRTYYFSAWESDATPLSRIFPYTTSEYHGFLEYITRSDGTPSAQGVGHGTFYLSRAAAEADLKAFERYGVVVDRLS